MDEPSNTLSSLLNSEKPMDRETLATKTLSIQQEIFFERLGQRRKWGIEVDDLRGPTDWHQLIADYNGWARRKGEMGNAEEARKRYIELAAIVVSVIESIDRFFE